MDSAVTSEGDAPKVDPASGMKFMLRALRHRNYRLFFVGQGISVIGTWLTTTATSWLVYRLARESGNVIEAAAVLGIVRFASLAPVPVLAPIAGVMIDRWNRHRVMVFTQFLSMLQSTALAVLTFQHVISVTQIIVLSVIQGLINAFDAPARQAFVVEIIERREDLPNAIALNSSMFNGARLLGPAIGGVLIWTFGEAWCFTIDAVSYLAVLIALLMMTLPPRQRHPRKQSAWRELHEGFVYAAGFAPVRSLLLLAGLISLTVGAYQTLMPIFASAVASPEHGSLIFGLMGAAVGVGSLAGAIYLASRRTVVGLGKVIAASAAVTGVALILFAATSWLPVMLVTSTCGGFGMIVTFAASNTLLQTIVDDHLRGRLMSLFVVAVMGAAPVGSLLAGSVAARVGEARTVMLSGVVSLIGAMLFSMKLPVMRKLVRPIYIRKGILPEVATGLQPEEQ